MIEIIYDKEKQAGDDGKKSDEKEVSIGLKLPKNIRQVGSPQGNRRIYIEDYVVTYLNYIARPGSTQARGAILLGEVKQSDVGNVIFISGAVDAQNIEFDMDESEFTQEAWAKIYEQVKEYFPTLSVVGWFLSRMGFSTAINEKIEKMHVDNFPGKDKVLFVTDSLESDEAFYTYERGQLIKQKGYYIYYSRNEAMQSYIVSRKKESIESENQEIQRKDEEVVKNYRQKNKDTQATSRQGNGVVYVASAVLLLGVIAMGSSVLNNYKKMKNMEITINRLELTAEQPEEIYTEVMVSDTESDNKYATDTDEDNVKIVKGENEGTEQKSDGKDSVDDLEKKEDDVTITKEKYLPAMTNGNPTYYKIKLGDSLTSIAYEYYGDIKYAKNIAKANDMGVDDKIYEGEEIILPSIKAAE